MRHRHYNKVQLLNFGVLVTGCAMCLLGALAPYWQEGNINQSYLSGDTHAISGSNSIDAHVFGGLWWYCYNSPNTTGNQCDLYPLGTEEGAIWAVRFFVFLNVILTLFCSMTIFFRICFQGVGRTICQGITAFVAGCCGFIVIGLFVFLFEEGYSLPLKRLTYSWVFYIYIVGCALVTVASGFLCLVIP